MKTKNKMIASLKLNKMPIISQAIKPTIKPVIVSIAVGDSYRKMFDLMVKSLEKVGYDGEIILCDDKNCDPYELKITKLMSAVEKYGKAALIDSDIIFNKNINDLFNLDGIITTRNPKTVTRQSHYTVIGSLDDEELSMYEGKIVSNTGFMIVDYNELKSLKLWLESKHQKTVKNDDQAPFIKLELNGRIKTTMLDICKYPYIWACEPCDKYFTHFASCVAKNRPKRVIDDMHKELITLP